MRLRRRHPHLEALRRGYEALFGVALGIADLNARERRRRLRARGHVADRIAVEVRRRAFGLRDLDAARWTRAIEAKGLLLLAAELGARHEPRTAKAIARPRAHHGGA